MRKIRVKGDFIVLHSGKVRLDPKQAKAREHGIRHVKDDTYEIVSPVGFKRGEVFYFDGEIGKTHVEDVEETRAPGRPAGKKEEKGPEA